MRRSFSRRERLLVTLLPAVLIAGIYAFAFEGPRHSEIRQLDEQTDSARRQPVSDRQLRAAQLRYINLGQRLDDERLHTQATTRPLLSLPSRWSSPSGRIDALAASAEIMESHGLHVASSAKLSDGDGRRLLSKRLADMTTALTKEPQVPVPEVWKIEIVGTYADMLAAVSELDRESAFIVPLAVAMTDLGPQTHLRRWTLWIWV